MDPDGVQVMDPDGVQVMDPDGTPASSTLPPHPDTRPSHNLSLIPTATITDDTGGFTTLDKASDVAIAEISGRTYAVVAASGDDGVQIIDITDPAAPTPAAAITDGLGGFTELRGPWDVAITQISGRTYAVVAANHDNGVQIIDITDPYTPTAGYSIDNFGNKELSEAGPSSVAIAHISDRTYAIVTDASYWTDDDIWMIDMTNSAASSRPVAIDYIDRLTKRYGFYNVAIAHISDRTYAVATAPQIDSVLIIDISYLAAPVPTDRWERAIFLQEYDLDPVTVITLSGANSVAIAEISGRTYAVVTTFGDDGVQIIDITDPAAPTPAAAITDDTGGFTELSKVWDVAITQIAGRTYAVVAASGDDGVQIIDITDPAAPTLAAPAPVAAITDDTGGFTALKGANSVAIAQISGRTYAVATGSEGVEIINISPSDSVHAYRDVVCDGQGAQVINISPSDPDIPIIADAGLDRIDLSGADLRATRLISANLREADLSHADLRAASLFDANLREADLSHADLRAAGLVDANLREADLSHADLSKALLSGADLREADLSHADLSEADLPFTDLRGTHLSGANISDANLYRADLRGANLNGADLRGANLNGADLRGASLHRALLPDQEDLADAVFGDLPIMDDVTKTEPAELVHDTGTHEADLRSADLRGASIPGARLIGVNLAGADLRGTLLSGANISGANLVGADLRGTLLSGANISGANLVGADLRGADLCGADLRGAYTAYADLRGAYIDEDGLNGTHTSEDDLLRAGLTLDELAAPYLDPKGLTLDDLREHDLTLDDLREHNLTLSKLVWAYLQFSVSEETGLPNSFTKDILGGPTYTGELSMDDFPLDIFNPGSFRGADFTGSDLTSLDLTDRDMTYADFFGAKLAGQKFLQTDLRGSSFVYADLQNAHLTGILTATDGYSTSQAVDSDVLTLNNYDNIDFSYANLQGARLSKNLELASFFGADLGEAKFNDAVLVGADLRFTAPPGIDLTAADLRFADLRFANLASAITISRGADVSSLGTCANSIILEGADLRFADFGSADLRCVVFDDADIRFADVSDATLPAGWDEHAINFR